MREIRSRVDDVHTVVQHGADSARARTTRLAEVLRRLGTRPQLGNRPTELLTRMAQSARQLGNSARSRSICARSAMTWTSFSITLSLRLPPPAELAPASRATHFRNLSSSKTRLVGSQSVQKLEANPTDLPSTSTDSQSETASSNPASVGLARPARAWTQSTGGSITPTSLALT